MSAPRAPMLVAEGVHKRYGREEVLKGIDLEVAAGEVLCLIGPSGSGKSTLLRCINHLERIDAGRIVVDGETVGYREHGGRLWELRERDACQEASWLAEHGAAALDLLAQLGRALPE